MSPLTQGRGSKHENQKPVSLMAHVAPHTGAWIETPINHIVTILNAVAPHTGAWIETIHLRDRYFIYQVAPHTGAWIETFGVDVIAGFAGSPLTQGRGSKHPQTL